MIAANKKNREPAIVRCAVYTRKSTDDGLEQEFNSLDAQRESGEAYIQSQKSEGWQLIPTQYNDGGYTGANMERPGLRQLLKDIEAGTVHCVVVYKVDRLSRSLLDFSKIMETFDKHNVAFVSVTQAFNTASSMGRLILNVLLSFAQFEREMISERTRDKIAATRRKGKWSGGMPVLGYNVQNGKLVVDGREESMVREIFQLYLELGSALEVAANLNARGWRRKEWTTRKGAQVGGKPFDKNSLYKLLSNVVYVGKVRHHENVYVGEHDGIVDPKIFERAQELLRTNAGGKAQCQRNRHHALLRGLVKCASCGCGMHHAYTTKKTRLYRYYVCQNAQRRGWKTCHAPSLPATELEAFVVEQIKSLGQEPSLVQDTIREVSRQHLAQIAVLKTERRTLGQDNRQKLDWVNGKHGDEFCSHSEPTVKTSILNNEKRLAIIATELDTLGSLCIEEDAIQQSLSDFEGLWKSMAPSDQHRVIQLLVKEVAFDGATNDLTISYHSTGIRSIGQQPKTEANPC